MTVIVTVSLTLTAGVRLGAAGVASQTVWFLTTIVLASECGPDTVIVATDEAAPALAAVVTVTLSLAALVLVRAAGISSVAFHRGIFIVDTAVTVTVVTSLSTPPPCGAAGVSAEGVTLSRPPVREREGGTTPQVITPWHCGGGGGSGGCGSGCCGCGSYWMVLQPGSIMTSSSHPLLESLIVSQEAA